MTSLNRMRRKLQGYECKDETVRDLRSASAFRSHWLRCDFVGSMIASDFSGAVIENSTFHEGASAAMALAGATLKGVAFKSRDMESVSFRGAVLKNVAFVGCRLDYASFDGATMDDVFFRDCNMHGTVLTPVEAKDLAFMDCNLWGAIVPIGCNFFNAGFDDKSARRFAAICARLFAPGESRSKLVEVAGDQMKLVERLMKEEADGLQAEDAHAEVQAEAEVQEVLLSGP